jgi:hypothetical protein
MLMLITGLKIIDEGRVNVDDGHGEGVLASMKLS